MPQSGHSGAHGIGSRNEGQHQPVQSPAQEVLHAPLVTQAPTDPTAASTGAAAVVTGRQRRLALE